MGDLGRIFIVAYDAQIAGGVAEEIVAVCLLVEFTWEIMYVRLRIFDPDGGSAVDGEEEFGRFIGRKVRIVEPNHILTG